MWRLEMRNIEPQIANMASIISIISGEALNP
jgi:hypothetical protein